MYIKKLLKGIGERREKRGFTVLQMRFIMTFIINRFFEFNEVCVRWTTYSVVMVTNICNSVLWKGVNRFEQDINLLSHDMDRRIMFNQHKRSSNMVRGNHVFSLWDMSLCRQLRGLLNRYPIAHTSHWICSSKMQWLVYFALATFQRNVHQGTLLLTWFIFNLMSAWKSSYMPWKCGTKLLMH